MTNFPSGENATSVTGGSAATMSVIQHAARISNARPEIFIRGPFSAESICKLAGEFGAVLLQQFDDFRT